MCGPTAYIPSGWITSGYFSLLQAAGSSSYRTEDNVEPNSWPRGHCIHGSSKYANNELLGAGINKDNDLRVGFLKARQMAVRATTAYFKGVIAQFGRSDDDALCGFMGQTDSVECALGPPPVPFPPFPKVPPPFLPVRSPIYPEGGNYIVTGYYYAYAFAPQYRQAGTEAKDVVTACANHYRLLYGRDVPVVVSDPIYLTHFPPTFSDQVYYPWPWDGRARACPLNYLGNTPIGYILPIVQEYP